MLASHQTCLFTLYLLLLAGCASQPEDLGRAELLDMPGISETLKTDTQTETIISAWPKAQWWHEFNNPELNRLIETALQDSPSLHATSARLTQAASLVDDQIAEMLPSVDSHIDMHARHFSGTDFYGANGGKTFTGAYIDPAMFRYHLDLWGKDKAALEAALGRERAHASELAVAKLLLSTTIARSYIRLCFAEEDIELAQSLNEKTAYLNQLAKLRWQRGLSSRDQVFASEQSVAAALQKEANASYQAQILRNQLSALAGKGPDWGKSILARENRIEALLPQPDIVSLGLLAHRPDVAVALWRVKAAAQMVKIAETNFYPDVNLVGFAGLRSLSLKNLFLSHGASVAYSIGPTLNLPVFEGGRLEAALKNQRAEYDVAAENYNETLLNAVQQVADRLAEWRQTLTHEANQDRALTAAQAAAALADKRFQAGISNLDAAILTQTVLIEQRLTSSEMRSAHLQAAIGLIEALGGGYENAAILNTQTQQDKQP